MATVPPAIPRASPPSASASPSNTKPILSSAVEIRNTNPVPLTASQEQQVRDIYYAAVRAHCAPQIRDFAHCATGRTFTIPIICRQQRLAMNTCMISHATREAEDAAREEWFRRIPERAEEKRKEEEWKESQRQKKREWWGVDEHGKRIDQQGRRVE